MLFPRECPNNIPLQVKSDKKLLKAQLLMLVECVGVH